MPCLSHIFYADFKLQRNKVQSRKLSFAVIENFDIQFIVLLLNEEKTIEKISLKRCCAKHGISKRILQNILFNLVAEAAEEVGFRAKHNSLY